MTTTDIEALVADGHAIEDRLYRRLGTKSARGLDIDACAIISKITDALERQQAVVEAVREYLFAIRNPTPSGDQKIMAEGGLKATIASLDAPPEGDGVK